MLHIPEDYATFFKWVKERSEAIWAKPSDDGEPHWLDGAKWLGMKDEDIAAVEQKYGIKFIPEHREFLRILHTIDRKDEDDRPFFYNWLQDHEEIADKLNWPYKTIAQDINGPNKFWLKSWGPKPESEEEKLAIFADWLAKAPKLIPIYSHRFVVSEPGLADYPVLSVWGSDIIVYGWDLRSYLLHELDGHLGLYTSVYDEEDKCYYAEDLPEVTAIYKKDFESAPGKDIPYWKQVILYWTSGWSSFGMKFPGYNGDTIQPIMKVDPPEGEEDLQKRFIG